MKDSTTKSLIVLSLLALAFSFMFAFAPMEGDDAIVVYGNEHVYEAPSVIDQDAISEMTYQGAVRIYVPEDASVKIKAQTVNIIFYVQSGRTLDLDFKVNPDSGKTVKIVTVAGDLQFEQAKIGTQSSTLFDGKYEYTTTSFEFAGKTGMSIYYKAATVKYDVKYDGTKFTYSGSLGSSRAMVSSDMAFDKKPIVSGSATASSSAVQVAPGQILEVRGTEETGLISGLNYGVAYTSVSGTAYTYLYYVKGSDLGEVDMSDGESLVIKEGSAAITTSGALVKVSSATGNITVLGGSVDGSLNVKGNLDKGNITFSGKVESTSSGEIGLTIKGGTSATFANKSEIVAPSTITVNGSLYVKTDHSSLSSLTVKGTTSGSLILQNDKIWTTDPSDEVTIPITITDFVGKLDTSAISKKAVGKGGFADALIPTDQTIELEADTTVYESLVVEGILIIDEGVTLIVENDATLTMTGKFSQIINNGRMIVKAGTTAGTGLVIDGGLFENNGTLEFAAKSYSERTAATFTVTADVSKAVNNGTVIVSKNDTISLSAFINDGSMTMSGKVVSASDIRGSGKLVFNGAEIHADIYATITASGGAVTVSSAKIVGDGNDLIIGRSSNGTSFTAAIPIKGTLTLKDGAPSGAVKAFTVRGLQVSASSSALSLKGSPGFSLDTYTQGTITMGIEGTVTVSDSFNVPRDLTIAFASGEIVTSAMASLSVSGTLTINKDTNVSSTYGPTSLNLTVTGEVFDYTSALQACNYTAAMYTTEDCTIFTTFDAAMSEALESGPTVITIGNTTITKDLTIPAGLMIVGRSDAVTFTVGSNTLMPTLTIESSGSLDVANILLKNGTISVEESTDINEEAVAYDLRFEDGDSVTYRSLGAALKTAQSGDHITVNKYYVVKDTKFTVPEGVTLDFTDNNGYPFAVIGSNLTVNGTLLVDDFYFISETNDSISITVNGTIKDQGTYDISEKWFTPVGVSYHETTVDPRGNDVTYYVITNLDNLQSAIEDSDDDKVTIEGKAKLGDISIKGAADHPAEVTFREDIDASTISIENAAVVALPGKQINAVFEDELGSITVKGAYAGGKSFSIYSLGQKGVYVSGPLTNRDNGAYSVTFLGKTGMDEAILGWAYHGLDATVCPDIVFAGDTLVVGKKNAVRCDSENHSAQVTADAVMISGSVTVENGSKLYLAGDVEVLGTLAAKEKDQSSTPGTVEVEGNIFLGTTKSAIYSDSAVLKAYEDNRDLHYDYAYYGKHPGNYTHAVASLSGKVEFVTDDLFLTSIPGSSINSSLIEDLESLTIFIDGKDWITVYGNRSFYLDGLTPDLQDCVAENIYGADGRTVAYYDRELQVIYGSEPLSLSTVDSVYIDLDYRVYTVVIKTDASIKAVYIDGILTYTGNNANQFYMPRTIAGTHTVIVEPVAGYSADNAYLYTDTGKKLSGMVFTFTEDDCIVVTEDNKQIYEVIYNVAGTERSAGPAPAPEEIAEWNVTTILLLAIVILIAFIAVIIALRLNRS